MEDIQETLEDASASVPEFITQEECPETENLVYKDQESETGEIGPFHLIKIRLGTINEDMDSQSSLSLPEIPVSKHFTQYQGSVVVKGKHSKYYKQTYRTAWELMPDFKGWLKGVKGQPTKAYCIYCKKTLHAHRLSLLKHTCTIRHQKAAQLHNSPFNFNVDQSSKMEENIEIDSTTPKDNALGVEDTSNDATESPVVYISQDAIEREEDIPITTNDNDFEEYSDPEEQMLNDAADGDLSSQTDLINGETLSNPISTQVTDTVTGTPVCGLQVSLYKLIEGRWTYINEGVTNTKGRYWDFFKARGCTFGRYKLHYDVDRYFDAKQQKSVFPFIETVFDITTPTPLHFPLLLNPNSYTTYKVSNDDSE